MFESVKSRPGSWTCGVCGNVDAFSGLSWRRVTCVKYQQREVSLWRKVQWDLAVFTKHFIIPEHEYVVEYFYLFNCFLQSCLQKPHVKIGNGAVGVGWGIQIKAFLWQIKVVSFDIMVLTGRINNLFENNLIVLNDHWKDVHKFKPPTCIVQ